MEATQPPPQVGADENRAWVRDLLGERYPEWLARIEDEIERELVAG